MPELIKEKKVNEEVKSLPEIKTDILVTNRELRLAHLLLSTITAGYIWEEGIDKVADLKNKLVQNQKFLKFSCHLK